MKDQIALRAFSLVELLTVVAVIALLASLLLPALSRAKQQAHSTSCKGKLRQMGLALALYADENASRNPYYIDTVTIKPPGIWWFDYLQPHLKLSWTNRVFHCPAYKGLIIASSDTNGPRGAYAWNRSGSDVQGARGIPGTGSNLGLGGNNQNTTSAKNPPPVRMEQIKVPSDFIGIADSKAFPNHPSPPVIHPKLSLFGETPETIEKGLPPRHPAGINLLFLDGHVAAIRRSHFYDPRRTAHRLNNDHDPHPDTW